MIDGDAADRYTGSRPGSRYRLSTRSRWDSRPGVRDLRNVRHAARERGQHRRPAAGVTPPQTRHRTGPTDARPGCQLSRPATTTAGGASASRLFTDGTLSLAAEPMILIIGFVLVAWLGIAAVVGLFVGFLLWTHDSEGEYDPPDRKDEDHAALLRG